MRFRIPHILNERGDLSTFDLKDVLGLEANTLHDHLDTLVDVGVVQNRKRKTADRDGAFSSYRVTALIEGILEHGVEELMRRNTRFWNDTARSVGLV